MTIEGVDYAWARPDPAGLYAAGKRFALRYVSYNTSGKNLTVAERDRLWAAGLAVCLNWENRADDVTDGYAGGARNATKALALAEALGWPASRPIYFSADQDTRSNPAMIDAYFKGIASVLPIERIGIYGGLAAVKRAKEQGLARWLWQTYAWSGGVWYPGVHLQQYRNGVQVAGADCDLNRAMVADYGQWTGDDMLLTDKLSNGWTLDNTLVTLLARTDYLANKLGLGGRLDAILAAATDDGDTTVVLAPEALAELTAIRDAVAALPVETVAELGAKLTAAG